MDAIHPLVVWGQDAEDPDIVWGSPMSHDFRENPGIYKPKSAAYYGIHGPRIEGTDVHTGAPHRLAKQDVRMYHLTRPDAFTMSQHDRNRLIRDATENEKQR